MQVALLGGSGRIGQHLLASALAAGHQVTALARSVQSIPAAAGLTVLGGDATDAGAVAELVSGADAVLSAVGPPRCQDHRAAGQRGRQTIAAMDKAGVRRLICVSAAGAFIRSDPDTGLLVKAILPRLLASQFADVRAMEAAIAASDLDWTLVRASRLVNSAQTGRYRVRPDYPRPGGRKIGRADVAHFMTAALADASWVRGRPALAY